MATNFQNLKGNPDNDDNDEKPEIIFPLTDPFILKDRKDRFSGAALCPCVHSYYLKVFFATQMLRPINQTSKHRLDLRIDDSWSTGSGLN